VEIGAEAAQFPEKEYINGIAVAVHTAEENEFTVCREAEKGLDGTRYFRSLHD
jgi:hypothetical protein